MTVTIRRAGALGLLSLPPELDRRANVELNRAGGLVDDAAVSTILASLRGVSALDSEGIRRLVVLRDEVMGADKAFHIVDLPPNIRYTLQIADLLDFLQYVDNFDAFLARHHLRREDFAEVSL